MTTDEKKSNVRNLHNAMAEQYSAEFFYDDSDHEVFAKFLNSLGGKKVLDAGCGDGKDVRFLLEQGFDPIGVDFTENFLEIAGTKVPSGRFMLGDITDLSYFADDSFDGIMAIYSLQHLPAELLNQTLSGFRRILKPDGQLLIALQTGVLGEQLKDEPFLPGQKLYINFVSKEQMEDLLFNNNFEPTMFLQAEESSADAIGDGKLFFQASNKKLKVSDIPRFHI